MKKTMEYLKFKLSYLENNYSFVLIETFKANTYFYFTLSNKVKNIKIGYDFIEDAPVSICIYDADDIYMFHYQYLNSELKLKKRVKDNYKNYKDIIDFALEKFYNMVDSKSVVLL